MLLLPWRHISPLGPCSVIGGHQARSTRSSWCGLALTHASQSSGEARKSPAYTYVGSTESSSWEICAGDENSPPTCQGLVLNSTSFPFGKDPNQCPIWPLMSLLLKGPGRRSQRPALTLFSVFSSFFEQLAGFSAKLSPSGPFGMTIQNVAYSWLKQTFDRGGPTSESD